MNVPRTEAEYTASLMHGLLVHSAGVQDRAGGRLVLEQCRGRMPRLQRIWADGPTAVAPTVVAAPLASGPIK